ncbi:protein kinase [Candidatus Gracilibacteria bacterium]|nr:protein kinase [Candidatus Gracilibacteria bacterium]
MFKYEISLNINEFVHNIGKNGGFTDIYSISREDIINFPVIGKDLDNILPIKNHFIIKFLDKNKNDFSKHYSLEREYENFMIINEPKTDKFIEYYCYIKNPKYNHEFIIMEKADICLRDYFNQHIDKLEDINYKENILKVILDIIESINICHSKGFIHRDIKTDNILIFLDNDNNIRKATLCDFGILKNENQIDNNHYIKSRKPCDLFYTPLEYICNEYSLKDNKPYSYTYDLWSLGVVIYELFNNSHPYLNLTAKYYSEIVDNYNRKIEFDEQFMFAIKSDKLLLDKNLFRFEDKIKIFFLNIFKEDQSLHLNNIPFEIKTFISQLLEKDPKKRISNFKDNAYVNLLNNVKLKIEKQKRILYSLANNEKEYEYKRKELNIIDISQENIIQIEEENNHLKQKIDYIKEKTILLEKDLVNKNEELNNLKKDKEDLSNTLNSFEKSKNNYEIQIQNLINLNKFYQQKIRSLKNLALSNQESNNDIINILNSLFINEKDNKQKEEKTEQINGIKNANDNVIINLFESFNKRFNKLDILIEKLLDKNSNQIEIESKLANIFGNKYNELEKVINNKINDSQLNEYIDKLVEEIEKKLITFFKTNKNELKQELPNIIKELIEQNKILLKENSDLKNQLMSYILEINKVV